MKARLLIHERKQVGETNLIEIKVWRVKPDFYYRKGYKYSFVFIKNGQRLLGFDNSERKGDHIHLRNQEIKYSFESISKTKEDFYCALGELMKNETKTN